MENLINILFFAHMTAYTDQAKILQGSLHHTCQFSGEV